MINVKKFTAILPLWWFQELCWFRIRVRRWEGQRKKETILRCNSTLEVVQWGKYLISQRSWTGLLRRCPFTFPLLFPALQTPGQHTAWAYSSDIIYQILYIRGWMLYTTERKNLVWVKLKTRVLSFVLFLCGRKKEWNIWRKLLILHVPKQDTYNLQLLTTLEELITKEKVLNDPMRKLKGNLNLRIRFCFNQTLKQRATCFVFPLLDYGFLLQTMEIQKLVWRLKVS